METATETAPCLDAKQLLAPFVGASDIRSWLNNPFSIGGDLLASNGMILVCVSGAGCDADTAPPDQQGVYALYKKGKERSWQGATIPANSVKPIGNVIEITCNVCDGSGRINMRECTDCDGEGDFDHGKHTYECKECSGNGYTYRAGKEDMCPECVGSGFRTRATTTVRHDEFSISYRYIHQLQQLPDCVIDPAMDVGFWFRFTGGWGLVMPVRV